MAVYSLPKVAHPDFTDISRKPHCDVVADRSDPIARGLVGLFDQRSPRRMHNLVGRRKAPTVLGTPDRASVKKSQAVFYGSGEALEVDLAEPVNGAGFTVLWFGTDEVDTSDRGMISLSASGNASDRAIMYVTGNDDYSWFSGRTGSNLIVFDQQTGPAPRSSKVPHVHVVRSGDSSVGQTWFVDGNVAGSNAGSNNITADLNQINISSFQNTSSGNAGSQKVILVAVWKRALTDREIKRVSCNPYQLFKPASDLFFFTPEAGGATTHEGAVTLSAQVQQALANSAVFEASSTLGTQAGLSGAVNATLNGSVSFGVSQGMSQLSDWVADAVVTLAAQVGDSYTYGSVLAGSLTLSASAGQSQSAANEVGASLTLGAQLTTAFGSQVDWAGTLTLSAQLDDGRQVSGTFDASIMLAASLDESAIAGLTLEDSVVLGAALDAAMASAILDTTNPHQVFAVELEDRVFRVAVELRSFTISKD